MGKLLHLTNDPSSDGELRACQCCAGIRGKRPPAVRQHVEVLRGMGGPVCTLVMINQPREILAFRVTDERKGDSSQFKDLVDGSLGALGLEIRRASGQGSWRRGQPRHKVPMPGRESAGSAAEGTGPQAPRDQNGTACAGQGKIQDTMLAWAHDMEDHTGPESRTRRTGRGGSATAGGGWWRSCSRRSSGCRFKKQNSYENVRKPSSEPQARPADNNPGHLLRQLGGRAIASKRRQITGLTHESLTAMAA